MKEKYHCPFEALVEIVGGKWKLLILWRLNLHDFLNFNEIQELTEGATSEVLDIQLRELENNNFIQRIAYPEIPPRVEYHITDLGRSLWPVLVSMQEWSIDYLEKNGIEIEEDVLEEFDNVKRERHISDMASEIIEDEES